jgi:outer membrane protein OmpA-like peptidoglycan-associated protein/tetratricopeptide (TPR) repeat protein
MKLYKHKVTVVSILLILAFTPQGFAQDKVSKAELEKATKEFKSLSYVSAIEKLLKLTAKDSVNIPIKEMLAYSYKMVENYTQTLVWYEKLSKLTPLKPVWALNFAEALANNQQYERSEGWYRKYLSMVPADKRAAALSVVKQVSFDKNIENWKISFTNLNTQSSEYAPIFYKNGLLFSSNRSTESISKKVFSWDNTPFTNLYVVDKLADIKDVNPDTLMKTLSSKGKSNYKFNDDDTAPTSNDTKNLGIYKQSVQQDTLRHILEKQIKPHLLKGGINTKYHEDSAAIFPDGSIIYTRNNYFNGSVKTSKDGINKLKLYTATGNNLNKITEYPYNSDEYSTGHPTINSDGSILIFVSDMPGGFGGTDLYYSVRSGTGQWTRPTNLGKQINTEGNEMFPHLDTNGTLYFASTGLPGLGGLDVFEIKLKDMKPSGTPRNLGSPINSSKDDFSLIKNVDGKSGFFTSNRRGDDDIYQFKRASKLIVLKGVITDARTYLPLANSRLIMRHLDGIDTLKTNNKGEFNRILPSETDYELNAQKLGYVNGLGFVTSAGITTDSVIHMDIKLNKTENLQQYVLNHCDSLKKVFSIKNIFYDLDRFEIRKDARPALDELASLMRKYPEIKIITSSHCDSRASEAYNKTLSLRRGESARSYLISKGIPANRIKVEYYGKTRLLNRCFDDVPCSEADQQLNRRTEFDVILNGVNLTQQNCND